MSDETVIYLARHGATPLNLEVPIRLQGNQIDSPLAPIGVEQATARASASRDEHWRKVALRRGRAPDAVRLHFPVRVRAVAGLING